jgi:hydrogenase nickel incorporation protein HypA/HybF
VHELSVAGAVFGTVERHAAGRPVTVVSVRVGRLRQVVPESLRFYWEIVAKDTICDGARLELEQVSAELACQGCGRRWAPELPAFRCARCGSTDVEVTSGDELLVEYIEVEQQEAECIAPG